MCPRLVRPQGSRVVGAVVVVSSLLMAGGAVENAAAKGQGGHGVAACTVTTRLSRGELPLLKASVGISCSKEVTIQADGVKFELTDLKTLHKYFGGTQGTDGTGEWGTTELCIECTNELTSADEFTVPQE